VAYTLSDGTVLLSAQLPIGRVAETSIAITHGDLHAGNLLIDDSNNIWVIDFERTGEGHVLQDFIELESDLINSSNTEDHFRRALNYKTTQWFQEIIQSRSSHVQNRLWLNYIWSMRLLFLSRSFR
jgi:thiamine kinase-like enzyme